MNLTDPPFSPGGLLPDPSFLPQVGNIAWEGTGYYRIYYPSFADLKVTKESKVSTCPILLVLSRRH